MSSLLLDEGRDRNLSAGKRSATSGQVRGLGPSSRDLIPLTPRLVAFNLSYLALAYLVAFGGIALFWLHPAWYTFALAFVVVASRQQALLNCEHEAVHRKFLPSRRWSEFAGRWFCAAAVLSPFGAAQARHLAHHRLLGSPDDPDRELHAGEDQRTRRGLARYFVSGLLGGYAGMVLMGPATGRGGKSAGTTRQDLISLAVIQGTIGASLVLSTAWWVYPALWLAPLATLTALCHLIRSYVEHAITDSEERGDHANRLITIHSNLIERALVSPYFMNYHAEHHLVPSIPAPRLRRFQRRLASREDLPPVLTRSSYGGALTHISRELPRR